METAIFELCGERELNPRRTFDCGQCFRWNEDETGRWRGVASGKAAVVWAEEGQMCIRDSDYRYPRYHSRRIPHAD